MINRTFFTRKTFSLNGNAQRTKKTVTLTLILLISLSFFAAYYTPTASAVVTWTYSSTTNTATASGVGSTNFAALVAADTAGGWGVFSADASGTQIILGGRVVIGDGTNACAFTDTNKEILAIATATSANYQSIIEVKAASTLTLGTLTDATLKTTISGCTIIKSTPYSDYIINLSGSTGTVNLYSTNVYSTTNDRFKTGTVGGSAAGTFKIYNCLFSLYVNLWYAPTFDVYRLTIQKAAYAFDQALNGVFSDISISEPHYCAVYLAAQTPATSTIKNLVCSATKVAQFNYAGRTLYLINPVVNTWSITFSTNGTLFRQYEFDLTTDAGATVTLKDNTGTTVFTETPATGTITTQTVSRGYYNQANGDTLQDYSPHTLTITKTGKQTYTAVLTLTEKTKWEIGLISDERTFNSYPIRLKAKR